MEKAKLNYDLQQINAKISFLGGETNDFITM